MTGVFLQGSRKSPFECHTLGLREHPSPSQPISGVHAVLAARPDLGFVGSSTLPAIVVAGRGAGFPALGNDSGPRHGLEAAILFSVERRRASDDAPP